MIEKEFKVNLGDNTIGDLRCEKRYDNLGRLVFERADGHMFRNWSFHYDDLGRISHQVSSSYQTKSFGGGFDAEGAGRKEFEYLGDSNKILREKWYDKPGPCFDDGQPVVWMYQYNENGMLSEKVSDHPSINWFDRWTYEYDSSGNLTKVKSYFRTGLVHDEKCYDFDEHGREILFRSFTKGEENSRYRKEYDSSGRLIRSVESYENRFTGEYKDWMITSFEYNGDRLIRKTVFDKEREVMDFVTVFEYQD